MDLDVVIEGVSDARGEWSVTVSPAETRGQWDLGVRGPFGRRFAWFADRAGSLPDLVAEQLRACL